MSIVVEINKMISDVTGRKNAEREWRWSKSRTLQNQTRTRTLRSDPHSTCMCITAPWSEPMGNPHLFMRCTVRLKFRRSCWCAVMSLMSFTLCPVTQLIKKICMLLVFPFAPEKSKCFNVDLCGAVPGKNSFCSSVTTFWKRCVVLLRGRAHVTTSSLKKMETNKYSFVSVF